MFNNLINGHFLLLANITVSLCFFLFLVVFNFFFFTIPVKIKNARLNFALDTPTGAPVAAPNDAIEIPCNIK